MNSPFLSCSFVGAPSGAMLRSASFYAPSSRGIPAVFHSPPGERVSSLCVAKEKAPRERPPRYSGLRASCPATAQRDSGGSTTVHPWTGVELGAIHCAHPAGYPCVTLPLHRRPIYCASCAAKTKQVPARFGFGFALRFGVHDARYMGPLDRGETAEGMSVGWPTRRGPVRRQSMDGLSANPGADSRTRSAGTVRRARVWGGLLFGAFLLATQEKDTRSPEASEKRQGCRAPQERALEEPSHWVPAYAGTTRNRTRVIYRHGCRAPQERAFNEPRHWVPASAKPSLSRACRRAGATNSLARVEKLSRGGGR